MRHNAKELHKIALIYFLHHHVILQSPKITEMLGFKMEVEGIAWGIS